jgi:hypothetical protein
MLKLNVQIELIEEATERGRRWRIRLRFRLAYRPRADRNVLPPQPPGEGWLLRD